MIYPIDRQCMSRFSSFNFTPILISLCLIFSPPPPLSIEALNQFVAKRRRNNYTWHTKKWLPSIIRHILDTAPFFEGTVLLFQDVYQCILSRILFQTAVSWIKSKFTGFHFFTVENPNSRIVKYHQNNSLF